VKLILLPGDVRLPCTPSLHPSLPAHTQALRCLKLYLERLGCVFGPDGTCTHQLDVKDCLQLVSRAVTDNEFLNYRPTITAAAVLYCERLHKGHLPFWPSSLSGLTSYSNARTPELSAAISGAQRLWKLLVAGQQKSAAAAASGAPAAAGSKDGEGSTSSAAAAGESAADDGDACTPTAAAEREKDVESVAAQLATTKV
jgi:pentatricopeptide repeat domain-containing protein 1